MKKVIKILVPVDFSACSLNALVFAIQLADKINAILIVLNVPTFESGIGESPVSMSMAIQDRISLSRLEMKDFIEKAKQNIREPLERKPAIQTCIEMGKIENTIIRVAASNEVDYIIMGTQGERNTIDKYLGSVASNTVKNAPCSVMVIPPHAKLSSEIDLGYATDLSSTDPYEIWKTVKLFNSFQAKVKCIHLNEKQINVVDEIEKLTTYFKETSPDLDISFYNLPVEDKVRDMNDFIERKDLNMLVMYKPNRNFFESLFHKSYTQKMAMHTNIPLLVLKQLA